MNTPYNPTAITSTRNKITRISWPALFAGALTAVVVVFMLNLLGLGIGLSTINPMTESDPLSGLGTGTLIWLGLSNLAALFVGGLVAGRMAGYTSKTDGGLHGFLAWALFTIVTVLLITSTIGSVISGVSGAISGIFGGDGSKDISVMVDKAKEKGQKATDLSYEDIKQEAYKLINKAENYNIIPDSTSRNVKDIVGSVKSDSKEALKNLDIEQFFNDVSFDLDDNGDLSIKTGDGKDFLNKEDLRKYITENTDLTDEQINGVINKWERKIQIAVDKAEKIYRQAKEKAIKLADKAADAAAKASFIAFIMFLLGAVAACLGGVTGAPKLTVDEEHVKDRRTVD